jgi:dTDP-4-amino-4,6-dideoxygalactose transaminase
MQAAILRARLPLLRDRTVRWRALAAWYVRPLPAGRSTPPEVDHHANHLFVVRVPTTDRDARGELQASLATKGVETLIHYPIPIPRQPALAGTDPAECPLASQVCDEILSLPLHPGMTDDDVDRVAAAVSRLRARMGLGEQ